MHPLVWISPIGVGDELASRAKAKTSIFRVFSEEMFFRRMFVLMQEDSMKVFSGHFIVHRSW